MEGFDPGPLAVSVGECKAFLRLARDDDDALIAGFNRIPNLTFEVIADAGAIDAGGVVAALAEAAGQTVAVTGDWPSLTGHVAARAGSLATALEPIVALAAARVGGVGGLTLHGDATAATLIPPDDADAAHPGVTTPPERTSRAAAATLPDVLEIGYFDPARDFQAGLQRARRGDAGGQVDHRDLPMAFDAAVAKAIAETGLARAALRRHRRTVRLPWRHAGIDAGDRVALEGSVWRVRERRFEGFVVTLDLDACAVPLPLLPQADAGRVFAEALVVPGATALHAFELPPLAGPLPVQPQIWVAAAGASLGWRRAIIEASVDDGGSYTAAGTAEAGLVMGTALGALPPGPRDRWDGHATVDVELLSDAMWLESRTPAMVLAGANLALIGDELVQFATATPLGPRQFRLSGFLRGRRGSEAAIAGHAAGERFVLIDTARLVRVDVPLERLGGVVRLRALGVGDAASVETARTVTGRALRPLAPVLRVMRDGSDVRLGWLRRSRAGFGWADFVDAPLGEDSEAYRVEVRRGGNLVRALTVAETGFTYTAAMQAADGATGALTLTVAQLSAQVGPGATASITLD